MCLHSIKPLGTFFAVLALCAGCRAEPRLPPLFSDGMVVQRDMPVPVWGTAAAGERIVVRLGAAEARVTAGRDGRWRATLPPQAAGGPLTMTVAGRGTVTVRDVLVGEVWLASGQSNMTFELRRASTAADDVPAARDAQLRLATVAKSTALAPMREAAVRWEATTPETAARFSAVAYHFGRELRRRLGVPVGIIHSSWPGTQAEEWTDSESLKSDAEFAPILQRWRAVEAVAKGTVERPHRVDLSVSTPLKGTWSFAGEQSPGVTFAVSETGARVHGTLLASDTAHLRLSLEGTDLRADPVVRLRVSGSGRFRVHLIQPSIRDWDNYASDPVEATAEPREFAIPFSALHQAGWGRKQPFTPESVNAIVIEPLLDEKSVRPPSGLYNGMIAPLPPYAIKGVIWYQGEGNAGRAAQYRKLLPAMIGGWRKAWGQGDFPFFIVQLPEYRAQRAEPSESDWAELREAQAMTAANVSRTGLVVTLGLGDADDVHPANKRPVGERLARAVSGESSAVLAAWRIEGAAARVRFTQPVKTSDGKAPRGFAVAGEDRRFVNAEARVEGDSVVVSSPHVRRPVAVRYAWADNPVNNVVNEAGWPVGPFRTDDWAGLTDGRR